MKDYRTFLRKISNKYGCNQKIAERALKQAYMTYLSIEELEPFILKELKGGKNKT